MTIQTFIIDIANKVISGILINLVWIIVIYICAKIIGREIKNLGKEVPKWIESYDSIKMKHHQIDKAVSGRTR